MFFDDYKLFWTNYANFKGRTPRHGFWFVQLWHVIINCACYLLMIITGPFALVLSFALGLYQLATIIPNLSLTVRRLHDIGKRATWLWFIYSPYIAMFLFAIIAMVASASLLGSSMAGLGYMSPYQSSSSYGLLQGLAGMGAGLLVFFGLISVYGLIVSIVWIVWMATDTQPGAIGISTHGDEFSNSYYDNKEFYDVPGYKKPVNLNPASASFALPEATSPTITGIEGMYRGYSIPLTPGKEFVLGRDSALSSIVVDQKANRVSRKHCGITYDIAERTYYVRDYSSNGTYCTDGSRLVANVKNPVKKGTIINLGSAENSFRLE